MTVAILASFGIMTASAADDKLELSVGNASGIPGSKVPVTVTVTKNPGITGLQLSPSTAAGAKATLAGAMQRGITESGLFTFDIMESNKITWANTAVVEDKKEFVILEFRIAADAVPGTIIPVTVVVNDSAGGDGKPVTVGTITGGAITVAPSSSSFAVTPANLSLNYKGSAKLTANGTVLNWTSSNSDVVTVDTNGNIEAVGRSGAATIMATTAGGQSATCTVTVSMSFFQWIVYILLFGWLWGF